MIINEVLVRELISKQCPDWLSLKISPVVNMGHDNRTFHLGHKNSLRKMA